MTNLLNYQEITKHDSQFIIMYDTVDLIVDTTTDAKVKREGDGYHYPVTFNVDAIVEIEEVALQTATSNAKINFNNKDLYTLTRILEEWVEKEEPQTA